MKDHIVGQLTIKDGDDYIDASAGAGGAAKHFMWVLHSYRPLTHAFTLTLLAIYTYILHQHCWKLTLALLAT